MSLTSLQTKGLKRHFREEELPPKEHKVKTDNEIEDDEVSVNAIKGSKKRRLAILQEGRKQETISDPNVVGFDVSD